MNIDPQEIARRLEAIENNVNANTAALMAVNAILTKLPAVSQLDRDEVKAIASASARQQESLARLLNDTHAIIDTVVTNAEINTNQ